MGVASGDERAWAREGLELLIREDPKAPIRAKIEAWIEGESSRSR